MRQQKRKKRSNQNLKLGLIAFVVTLEVVVLGLLGVYIWRHRETLLPRRSVNELNANSEGKTPGQISEGDPLETVAIPKETIPETTAQNPESSENVKKTTMIQADGEPAFPLSDSINIREGSSVETRIIGTLEAGDLCYILADADQKWVFVESGLVRGFVRSDLLETGSRVQNEVREKGEAAFGTATVLIWPRDNAVLYYTLNSVKPEMFETKTLLIAEPGEEGIRKDNADLIERAEDTGYHVYVDLTDHSNVLVIGDSRIVGLSDYVGRVSYVATVGGHYRYNKVWAERFAPVIIALGLQERNAYPEAKTGYYGEMISLAKSILEKHGSCYVIIAATVNDLNYNDWCSNEASSMIELGKALKEDATLDDGLSPDVYYMGIVPTEGNFETDYLGETVKSFNEYLKNEVTAAAGENFFIDIGDPAAWNGLYRGDGVHFEEEGSQKIFDQMVLGLQYS